MAHSLLLQNPVFLSGSRKGPVRMGEGGQNKRAGNNTFVNVPDIPRVRDLSLTLGSVPVPDWKLRISEMHAML